MHTLHCSEQTQKTVVVGMSGGVDSSVAALLLKLQGFRVIGLFMKNWEEDEQKLCHAQQDYEDVVAVCQKIDIPYYSVNFVQEYWDQVFVHFLAEYRAGHTPNPDILCNREIKFKVFFDKAMQLNADYLATGHYCQIRAVNGVPHLVKGLDPNKDQSYFLYTIKSQVLEKVLFPLGHLPKQQVRQIALDYDLPTAKKKDSVGICFIGKRNFKEFLSQYLAVQPGNFEDLDGNVIGKHEGIAYYTIGQRKGLQIGGAGDAWFVAGKDVQRNVVILVQGQEHPALYSQEVQATEWTWVTPQLPQLPLRCCAKVRYRQQEAPCTILSIEGDSMHILFDQPQKAVTPRQSIVFYQGDLCLGGAMIAHAK